jgi:hypothetical protein
MKRLAAISIFVLSAFAALAPVYPPSSGSGGGGGSVTSVGLSTNASWLAAPGSPVTSSGVLALNLATGLTGNRVLATPDGTTGTVGLRALTANDLPSLPESKITGLTGDLASKEPAITPGTTAQYFRGDKTFQTLDESAIPNLVSDLAGKEPAIAVGTSAQYYRGDKTWQTLNEAAIPSLVSDLAAKEPFVAAGTTAQYRRGDKTWQTLNEAAIPSLVSDLAGKEPSITAGTSAQYFRGDKTFQTLNTAAVPEVTNLYFTNARAIGSTLTEFTAGAGTVSATDSVLSALQKHDGNIAGKEPTISAGTSAQYYRGDKTFQTLNTTAVAEGAGLYFTNARGIGATLTGFTAGTGTVSASDSILSALQKHDGNIAGKEPSITAGTTSQYFRGDKTFQTLDKNTIGLGSVTNDAQAKAAIIPNTVPTSGQLLIGNAGGTAYAPVTVSGSGATITLNNSGVLSIGSIPNSSLANSNVTVSGHTISLGGSYSLVEGDVANLTSDLASKATKRVFDVKADYGAVGDGATSDATAFDNAILAMPSTGGTLLIPEGNFLVPNGINLHGKSITVLGMGGRGPQDISTLARSTVTVTSGTANGITNTANGSTFMSFEIHNPTATPTAGAGIATTLNGELTTYFLITVDGFYIDIDHQTGVSSTWENVYAANPVLYGLKLQNSNNIDGGDWAVSNSWFHAGSKTTNGSAIRYESGGGLKIGNCKTNTLPGGTNWNYGLDVNLQNNVATTVLLVHDNSFEGWSVNGIALRTQSSTVSFGSVIISDNHLASNVLSGSAVLVSPTTTGEIGFLSVSGNLANTTTATSSAAYSFVNVADMSFSMDNRAASNFSNISSFTNCSSTSQTLQNAQFADGAIAYGLRIDNMSTAYNGSPLSGLGFAVKYNSSGAIAAMGGIAVGKENASDGDYGGFTAFYTRQNGQNITQVARFSSLGALGIIKGSAGMGNSYANRNITQGLELMYDPTNGISTIASIWEGVAWQQMNVQASKHQFYVGGGASPSVQVQNGISVGSTTDAGAGNILLNGVTANTLLSANTSKVVTSATGSNVDGSGNVTIGGSLAIGGGAAITKSLTATAALDFGSTAAQTSAELSVTVTGAADGDDVIVSPPNASVNANSCFTARVSAANTVQVKFNNYSSSAIDPASGTFRVTVLRF